MALDKNDIKIIKEIIKESSHQFEDRLIQRMDSTIEQTKEAILAKTEMILSDQSVAVKNKLDDSTKTQHRILNINRNKLEATKRELLC